MIERPIFTSREEYGARFTDASYWQPYIAQICGRHGLACSELRAGLPGTNAVFLVDGRHAVKLYPDLFGGAISEPAERACYALVAAHGGIPAPALIAHGDLFDAQGGWRWPYIITSVLPGLSLGESAEVSYADRLALAGWLGGVLRQIHELPLERSGPLRPDWAAYHAFLASQRADVTARQAAWGVLPPHLCAQLEGWLPPAEALVGYSVPRLLHGDLNRDHVLGMQVGGHWQPTGVIDFGDARVGDPAYDLVALHLGLFDADKRLLEAFLHSYGGTELAAALPRRALALTLLHEFTVLGEFAAELASVPTLDALALLLWSLDAPGIGSQDQ
jgi:hygromycin-B 7''-O-kinase